MEHTKPLQKTNHETISRLFKHIEMRSSSKTNWEPLFSWVKLIDCSNDVFSDPVNYICILARDIDLLKWLFKDAPNVVLQEENWAGGCLLTSTFRNHYLHVDKLIELYEWAEQYNLINYDWSNSYGQDIFNLLIQSWISDEKHYKLLDFFSRKKTMRWNEVYDCFNYCFDRVFKHEPTRLKIIEMDGLFIKYMNSPEYLTFDMYALAFRSNNQCGEFIPQDILNKIQPSGNKTKPALRTNDPQ
jgi:hypothetical protein